MTEIDKQKKSITGKHKKGAKKVQKEPTFYT